SRIKTARSSSRAVADLFGRTGSDRLFQFLGGAEGDFLARFDFDRLTGRRVAAHACGALTHLQDAESADPNARALLQVLGDGLNHLLEHGVDLLFGQLVRLRKGLAELA